MKDTHTNNFDQLLRQRLERLAPPPSATRGWEDLERKLQAAEAESAAQLDRAIARGLSQSAPTASSGWVALAARLELIATRREMIGCMKITEAALLVSLLLLFARFGPGTTERTNPQLAELNQFPVATPIDRSSLAVAPIASVALPVAVESVRRNQGVSSSYPQLRPNRLFTATEAEVATATLPATPPQPIQPIATEEYSLPTFEIGLSPALSLPLLPRDKPVGYYLSTFISQDINQVVTPRRESTGVEGDRRVTFGYSAGALIDFQQGKNALQTGFIYGRRSYLPTTLWQIQEQPSPEVFDASYSRFTFHTVTVPLNYQRELAIHNTWRLTGRVGIAMNVVVSSKFTYGRDQSQEDLEDALRRYQLENPNASSGGRAIEDTENFLNPDPGYFQGGSLLANSSFYVNGGFMLERIISERLSLYFSPSISRSVSVRKDDGGKGPLDDRIHTANLRLGTRVSLSNK